MRKVLVALAVVVSAAAATDNAKAAISDETLIAIFGDGPTHIRRPVEDCIRLVTGLDEAIHKDTPDDVLGMLKTQCRKELKWRLDDPERNPTGLRLEDVEEEEVARRVSQLRQEFVAAAKAEWEAKQKEKAAGRKATWLQKRNDVIAYYSNLDQAFAEIDPVCSEWKANLAAVPAEKRRPHWEPVSACRSETRAAAIERAQAFVEKLEALDEEIGAKNFTDHLLRPGTELSQYSPEELAQAERRMRGHIKQMKRRQES